MIASWNIKWLGQSEPVKRDFETMADIIEEFDIVAIQEIRGKALGSQHGRLDGCP